MPTPQKKEARSTVGDRKEQEQLLLVSFLPSEIAITTGSLKEVARLTDLLLASLSSVQGPVLRGMAGRQGAQVGNQIV